MTEELQTLWSLHELDERLVHIHDQLKHHPEVRRTVEAAVAGEKARLAAHQQRLTDLRAARRLVEQDIETLTGEEKKFQSQLPLIKKNEEYQALLHEISDRKTRKSDLETDVLMKMEEDQELVTALPAIEKALAEAQATADARLETMAAEEERARADAAVLESQRATLVPKLPQATRLRYERIRESRGGRAVVAIVKGSCGGCFRGQPPQVLQEAKRGDRVLICDGCGRMLIHPPEAA
jgi:predicted  nucleic acid-binding Zn-ribbon protein